MIQAILRNRSLDNSAVVKQKFADSTTLKKPRNTPYISREAQVPGKDYDCVWW